jgi:outer membrane protein TolC
MSLNVEAMEQMAEASRKLVGFAESRESVGVGTDSDTAVARANVSDMENQLEAAKYAKAQALRSLELLIGRYPAAEVNARTDFVAMPADPPVGAPLQMLERRPDVIAAERRVAAAFHRVGEAKAARLPQITLNLNIGAFDSEILALKEDYENPSGGIGARIVAPLYTGGKLTAQIEIRTAEQKEAVADYARTALRAINDVENSLAASQSLATRVSLLNRSYGEQSRALELTETRYRIGRTDQRAIEQQRLSAQSARMALVDVQSQQLIARVNLHLALGGSFEQPQQKAEAEK